ncbi:MAG: N-acetylglucosamine-6-phosphate deacetylase [Alphaproteobacteria bacterium]|nr:N-acetylglucosamine-6-phosphate deacetylase [Alphaproteobacteria bacterium]
MSNLSGRILTPDGWVAGRIEYDEKIASVVGDSGGSGGSDDGVTILPGFVDLHVPGGGGGDVMQGLAAIRRCAALHASHGTTSFLATTITAPADDIDAAVAAISEAAQDRGSNEARILGAHLEGPYLNPERLGAQPPFAQAPDLAFIGGLCDRAPIRLVTLAPECDPGHALIKQLAARDVAVQIGHSGADYDAAMEALAAGARGFTHLYNAMSPLHHRAPGVVGAALAHGEYAALIPDLVHVAPGAILAALRAVPRLYFVTDATAAAGMPDGEYPLGRHTVTKRGGTVFLADGTLAGSALTMDQALRNLVSIGVDLADAAQRLATYPADFIGAIDRGRIETGAYADFVALDAELQVTQVVVEGETVFAA